jgi:magnesium and cobalt exporter, CNNM family
MIELLIILLCLFLNALLAGCEMGFVAVSRPTVRELARQGHKKAKLLIRLRDNPERTLSVIQIGITLVGALAGAVGGVGAEELLSPSIEARFELSDMTADTIAIIFVVLPLTYLTVVIGELVPKSLALRAPLRFALQSAPWLYLFERLLGPVVTVLEWSTKQLLKFPRFAAWLRQHKARPGPPSPEEHLGEHDALRLEPLSSHHRQYVVNLVDLERKTVQDIFLPWHSVVAIDLRQPLHTIEEIIVSSGHTRLPVLNENKLIGILNAKEFIALRASGREDWSSILRPAVVVQSSTALLTGFRLLQERRMHFGIVYGGSRLRYRHTGRYSRGSGGRDL